MRPSCCPSRFGSAAARRIRLTSHVQPISVRIGKSASGTYSIARSGGFDGVVSVTAEKLSAFDATLSLTPDSLSGTTTSTSFRVSTSRSTAAGTYQVRLRFTNGSLVKEQIVTVTVTKR